MSARKRKKAPRSLSVNRGGAWGYVRYERKRAWYYGCHFPVDAVGIYWTRIQTQNHLEELKRREDRWRIKTTAEILVDIHSFFAAAKLNQG